MKLCTCGLQLLLRVAGAQQHPSSSLSCLQMEFEDVLPYHQFALRVPPHAIYMLPTILERVLNTPGKVDSMRAALTCVWRYFLWRQPDGRALEALMCSLRQKLTSDRLVPHMNLETCHLECSQPQDEQSL